MGRVLEGDGVVFDERTQGRVRMMPLDVMGADDIRARLRSYLTALGVAPAVCEAWVEQAAEGTSHCGQAFVRLQACMAAALGDQAPGLEDASGCAALWRLSAWLATDAQALAALQLSPPLSRQSMASERKS